MLAMAKRKKKYSKKNKEMQKSKLTVVEIQNVTKKIEEVNRFQ